MGGLVGSDTNGVVGTVVGVAGRVVGTGFFVGATVLVGAGARVGASVACAEIVG